MVIGVWDLGLFVDRRRVLAAGGRVLVRFSLWRLLGFDMQKSGNLSKNNSLKLAASPQSLRRLGICSQISTGQHSSPVVFPEKRSKGRSSARSDGVNSSGDSKKEKGEEHRIDVGDENSDLLGYDVFSGKLVLDKKKACKNAEVDVSKEIKGQNALDAKLTSKAMIWGSEMLALDDIVSVSSIYS